jgi:hypothetical protein
MMHKGASRRKKEQGGSMVCVCVRVCVRGGAEGGDIRVIVYEEEASRLCCQKKNHQRPRRICLNG